MYINMSDLSFVFRLQLLLAVARHRGHSKVIVGDTATRLSTRLVASITQGRGAHLAHDMVSCTCLPWLKGHHSNILITWCRQHHAAHMLWLALFTWKLCPLVHFVHSSFSIYCSNYLLLFCTNLRPKLWTRNYLIDNILFKWYTWRIEAKIFILHWR